MADQMNALEVKNIYFSYNTKEVITDVSFSLGQGEFLGLIGPNGAGKSTLLRIMCQILRPQKGEIFFFGKDVKYIKPKELAQQIGFVPQETHFTLNFGVEDIVQMGRYPYLEPFSKESHEDIKAVEQAIDYAEVRELRKRPINSLSSGEKQRVVVARALAQSPRILLLDEPTSHLDLHHQYEIMELLKKMNGQGISLIIVHHDLNLANLYCKSLILMHLGKIYAQGTPKELINEKMLRDVYKSEVKIIDHPDKGVPQVLLK